MRDKNNSVYFLLGLGTGLIAGILWALKAGAETRSSLTKKATEGTDYVKRNAQTAVDYAAQRTAEIKKTAEDALDRTREMVMTPVESLAAAVSAAKDAYGEALEKVSSASTDKPS